MATAERNDKDLVNGAPYLKKIYGDEINKKIRLNGPTVMIGRNPKCNIRVDSTSVSRSHCTLKCLDGKWTIQDNKSQNGTFVNGAQLKLGQVLHLQFGDIIFLGPPSEFPEAFIFDDFPEEEEDLPVNVAVHNYLVKEMEFKKSGLNVPETNTTSELMKMTIKFAEEDLELKRVAVNLNQKMYVDSQSLLTMGSKLLGDLTNLSALLVPGTIYEELHAENINEIKKVLSLTDADVKGRLTCLHDSERDVKEAQNMIKMLQKETE